VSAYYVFRHLLGPVDSSVRLVRFSCKLIIPIVLLALLDPLTGSLFTYEIIKGLTGYVKVAYENALASGAETVFRGGVVRAMGPLEHSILFGAVCVWLGALALITFPFQLLGWSVVLASASPAARVHPRMRPGALLHWHQALYRTMEGARTAYRYRAHHRFFRFGESYRHAYEA